MWTHINFRELIQDILQELPKGIVYGGLSAILVNFLRPKPRIHICKQIAKYGDNKYKIKIINKSIFKVYDITGYVIYFDVASNSEFVTPLTTRPILKGFFSIPNNEYITTLDPQKQIIKEKIETLREDSQIRIQYKNELLSIKDFCIKEKLHVSVSLSATHSKSGLEKIFTRNFTEIVPAEWQEGKCKLKLSKSSKEIK